MRGALGGPRLLLRRLREVMAEPVSAQARLDKIVVLIANNMVAEVCSFYVLRADGTLELYATEGLNRDAVHLTTMQVGEGLVGLIAQRAQPLNLPNAQSHPSFSYKPETGEEIYQSFLGVPVLRAGNTLGVLVVQNRAHRLYSEEEVEAMQTTAMVLAEIIASGELQTLVRPGTDIALRRPMTLSGECLSDGVGLGHVVLHEPRVVVSNLIADDPAKEIRRLDEAIADLRSSIDALIERGDVAHGGEHRDVLETFRMFAHDQGWLRRLREVIQSGLTAEAAVERVQSDNRAKMMRQTDPYLRERLHDLDELANRLLHRLVGPRHGGRTGGAARQRHPRRALDGSGRAARLRPLAPARPRAGGGRPDQPRRHRGARAGHPGHRRRRKPDEHGGSGRRHHRRRRRRPGACCGRSPTSRAPSARRPACAPGGRSSTASCATFRAVTRDGVEVSLHLNAGLLIDLPHLDETGAHGIGLFRTELQFMIAERLPSTSEQLDLYRTVMESGGPSCRSPSARSTSAATRCCRTCGRSTRRTRRWAGARSASGSTGRACCAPSSAPLLKAAGGREISIMFPMIATVRRVRRAKELRRARERASRTPRPPTRPPP